MPPPEGENEDPNCPVWGEVDFGKGTVDVRCTRMGEHDEHACFVLMVPEPTGNGEG